jgi:hypothetical protein
LTDKQLVTLFDKNTRARDNFWKTVACAQVCVKDQLGIGKPMYLQFYAPLDERSDKLAAKEINYDHK